MAPKFRPGRLEPWQRSQLVVLATVVLAQVGFDLTQPFIPLYVRYLGTTDLNEAALWSGIVVGIGPLCASLMGPFWGALGDRLGHRMMVVRALAMISLMQLASGFVPDVRWLLVCRVVMGLFAGFTTMVLALAISVAPREKMSQAIGLVQAAQLAPTAFGPLIGGVLSDTLGPRANFVTTGLLLLVPVGLLILLVDEGSYASEPSRQTREAGAGRNPVFSLLLFPPFLASLGILFVARFTDRALPPILPLYLIQLDTPVAQLATITGLVVASGAIAAACSAVLYGRQLRPENVRRLLLVALVGGGLMSLLLSQTQSWVQVTGVRLLLGLLAGGAITLAYTLGARHAPTGRSGLTFSVLGSCGQLGAAVSPMLAGVLSQSGLRTVFLANGAAYLLAAALAAIPAVGAVPAPAPAPEREPAADTAES
ncbi:MAG: MFS transporter [Chloroflexi bacterium]|nr:MFS transporter [Chloroflexota bacterium]